LTNQQTQNDWLEQDKRDCLKKKMSDALGSLEKEDALVVLRDITIDQICIFIDRFPEHTQKEIVTLTSHRYLTKWNKNNGDTR